MPVRKHLRRLEQQGATARWIAEQSGVAERTVRSVLRAERQSLYAGTAAALMALQARPGTSRRRVDPEQTIERVNDLVARHWPVVVIAEMAGVRPRTLTRWNMATGVSEQTQAGVLAVWEHLQGQDGPAPREYPWLAERLAQYPARQAAAGAGVSLATVYRLRSGQPVARQSAARAMRWLQTAT